MIATTIPAVLILAEDADFGGFDWAGDSAGVTEGAAGVVDEARVVDVTDEEEDVMMEEVEDDEEDAVDD